MAEVYKDIPNYVGLYQISNLGNVKSLQRKVKNKNGYRIVKEKILKPYINNCGYYCVNLRKKTNVEIKLLHRLVAENFIKNDNKLSVVNHIDGDKLNNNIENLEWCTYSHNNKEAYKRNLKKPTYKGKFGKEHNRSKIIEQYDKKNNLIKIWYGSYEVERNLGINHSQIINCCNKRQKTSGGFIWKYKEV